MTEWWLHKAFPADLFANANLPENTYRVCVGEKEIKQLSESSTNMLDRQKDRLSSKFRAGQ